MKISYELLNRCAEFIANETKLEELILLIGNSKIDEDTGTYIASYILESLILEKISNHQKTAIETEYARIGKSKASALEKRKEKRKLEDSFAVGISAFISVFDDVFENKDILLKKLRKLFKNYRFRKLNVVNDYSIFFFTFCLFDIYCSENYYLAEMESMAEILANACFEELHNPYNKRKITIYSSSLLRYVKQFSLGNYKEMYVRIFIKYIQELNNSETIPDYIRYDIYSRFGKDIIKINTFLRVSEPENTIKLEPEKDGKERLNVNKYISNKIQKFKRLSVPTEYITTLKEIQKNINWLSKKSSDTSVISKKKIYKCCHSVYNGIRTLSELENKGFYNDFCDIINTYKKLNIDVDGEEESLLALIVQVLEYEDIGKIMEPAKYVKDNIYIELLLSNILIWDVDHSKVGGLYVDVLNSISKYIDSIVEVDCINTYDKVIKYVELDRFQVPILTVTEHSSAYNTAMLYMVASI